MKKLLVVLLFLSLIILGSLLAVVYKIYINPEKVIIVPINPNYNMPIAPSPDWSTHTIPKTLDV